MRTRTFVPDGMPRLSPGRHRSPRRGACFMEFASYLAGERWSDHPACTDRMLAALARGVNDLVKDDRRGELVPLIPRVVGLTGENLGFVVTLRAAVTALPVASMERQQVLASGALSLRRLLEERGVPSHALLAEAQHALDTAPDTARWAQAHVETASPLQRYPQALACDVVLSTAIVGAARACVDDPDALLIRMLTLAVDDVEALVRPAPAPTAVPAAAPLREAVVQEFSLS